MASTLNIDTLNSYDTITVTSDLILRYGNVDMKLVSRFAQPSGKTKNTYIPTNANQTFTVPAGINHIYAKVWGAGGAGGNSGGWSHGSKGGGGGHTCGIIPVIPGEVLTLVVGVGGQTNYSGQQTPRYGGGGGFYNNSDNRYAGSGGGLTGIFRGSVSQANALIVAGGGGGGGSSRMFQGNWGGAGGGNNGQAGNSPFDGRAGSGGAAGYQFTAFGAAGTQSTQGTPGSPLQGGYSASNAYGGGGGGGYWGGGGGGYFESYTMAGGGGGSGFIAAQVIHGQTYRGAREIPAMADDPDLPQSIDSYSGYAKYGWGGEIIINSSQYTSAGGGGGYCVIYY